MIVVVIQAAAWSRCCSREGDSAPVMLRIEPTFLEDL
jgi:hypothetical protein